MHPGSVKKLVRRLRKQGCSIITLSRRFKVAKSTVSLWVRDIELPLELRKYLTDNSAKGREKGLQVMKAKGREKGLQVMKARREIDKIKDEIEAKKIVSKTNFNNKNIARLYAATIFWCEGSKRPLSNLCFTNSDSALIKLFLKCLRAGFDIDEKKFRGLVHLHEYHNENRQIRFWSGETGIPRSQFTKSFFKKHTGIRKRTNYQGCLSLRYYDSKVARKLDAIYHILAKSIGP